MKCCGAENLWISPFHVTLFDIINTSHSTYVLTLICKLHFVITRNVHILHVQRVHRVMHINETLPIFK